MLYPQLSVGVGMYWVSVEVSVLEKRDSPLDESLEMIGTVVSHCALFFNVLPTNYSDPPFVHCAGDWYYNAQTVKSAPARICAWC